MLKICKTHNKDQFTTIPPVILSKDFIPDLNSLFSTDRYHGLDSTILIEILTWDQKSCEGSRSGHIDLTEYLVIWRRSISNSANQHESFLSRKSLSMTQQLSLPGKTLPKALQTQVLAALTSNFGLVGLVWQVSFGRFGLVGLVW